MSSVEALKELRILVVHPHDSEGMRIVRCLRRIGCDVETIWPPPTQLSDGPDVVFFLIDEGTRRLLSCLGNRPPAAIVGIVAPETPDILRLLADCGPHAVVGKPTNPFAILTSLSVAHNIFRYEGRLHTKIRKLEETLRSVRRVEQAKTILMRTKNIKEQEAYEYLRRYAMNKGLPIGKVASAVIDTTEMLS
jgi:AmiR/NasT family two-component response regulator